LPAAPVTTATWSVKSNFMSPPKIVSAHRQRPAWLYFDFCYKITPAIRFIP